MSADESRWEMALRQAKHKTKWQVKREASHEALVGSAMHRFHTQGYAATTVEDVVEGTGYTTGAFYFHFRNKRDCFWHVIEHRQALRAGWWEEVLADVDPVETSLEEALRSAMHQLSEKMQGTNAWILVMVDFYEQEGRDEEVGARLASVYASWIGELARFVDALRAGGWQISGMDSRQVATRVLAYVDGLVTHATAFRLPAEENQRALSEGLLRLFGAP
jgi:AcrR family transcriptional regulator